MAGLQLQPYPRPLGIFQPFIANQQEILVLKEKVFSLSGDSFSIKTLDGRDVMQCAGEAFSLSGRKHLRDMSGTSLFDIRKQHLTIPSLYYGEAPDGQRLFEVKSKISFGSSKQICTFHNPMTGKDQALLVKGDFFGRKADITCEETGQVVATIDRSFFNAGQLLAGQQTYVVAVAPNVDLVLVAAMCICLDEKRSENRGNTAVIAAIN